jgi:hypothetical protein
MKAYKYLEVAENHKIKQKYEKEKLKKECKETKIDFEHRAEHKK